MISCRKHLKNIERIGQNYQTRQNKIRLGMNEYVPSMPKDLFDKILKDFTPEIASSYPEVNQAYDALAKFLDQSRDRILITNGADAAIKMTLETFCDQGDEVATISPTFAMYKVHTLLLDCKFREVYCDQEGSSSLNDLLSLVGKKTKVVILANPSGVTGFVFSIDDIRELVQKADKQDTLVVIDETYADFADVDTSPLLEEFSNLVIIRSFSKNIGMAGIRIGYVLASKYLAGMIEKFRPMMDVSSLAVKALIVICEDKKYLKNAVEDIKLSRSQFANSLKKMGYKIIERGGNFVLIDFGKMRDKISDSLDKNNIEYREFSSPLEKYIRITVATKGIMAKVMGIIANVK